MNDDNNNSAHNFERLKVVLTENQALDEAFLLAINYCKKCSRPAKRCEVALNHRPGKCLILHCGQNGLGDERCPNWFACVNCKRRVSKKKVRKHFQSEGHRNVVASEVELSRVEVQEVVMTSALSDIELSDAESADFSVESAQDEDNAELSFEGIQQQKLSWLEQAFESTKRCDIMEVMKMFVGQDLMQYYWSAEIAGFGNGMRYLVARTFQRTECIVKSGVPSMEEARWHILSFIQYNSMSDKQRRRQALVTERLLTSLDRSLLSGSGLVYANRVLSYRDLNRYYGRSSVHSLWNTLPIPKVQNIGGIAYVSPLVIIRFIFAMGLDVDDIIIDTSRGEENVEDDSSTTKEHFIFDVADSKVMSDARAEASAFYSGSASKFLLAWAVDWRDGFNTNRAKSMRKSLVAWTWTFSPPKEKINGLDNTFAMAIGMKKNNSWKTVEHLYRRDLLCLSDPENPFFVYHGGLRKIIPVYVKRIASLEDKVERADISGTMACTSNYHRIFGLSLRCWPAPTVRVDDVSDFLFEQSAAEAGSPILKIWGWCSQMLESTTNSVRLASCMACRKSNLEDLRGGMSHPSCCQCSICAHWTVSESTKEILRFPSSNDYPTWQRENCPVQAPPERVVGLVMLTLVFLTFPFLKTIVKFAYYNSMGNSRRGQCWTKKVCQAYLQSCCVSGNNQDLIYADAQKSWKENIDVDFTREDRVGNYVFPASWQGELPLSAYIETLMHLLFIGDAKANVYLQNVYMKINGLGVTTFRRDAQSLMKELARLHQSWLLIEPFSWSEKNEFTTGTWVGENWLAWVRISKVTGVWFLRRGLKDERIGCNDVLRMVISFHSLVSLLLSHSGVSERQVRMVDGYVKEFLSSTRELDVRCRYKEINKRDGGGKQPEQYWLKSNYLSLLNLVATIRKYGPLKNMWDGGGKGERYIQLIKPLVPRGVRDKGLFFVRLMEKLYKFRVIEYLEERCRQSNTTTPAPSATKHEEEESDASSISETDTVVSSVSSTDTPVPEQPEREEWFTQAEDQQMSKARTIHIYKNRTELERAIDHRLPIAGAILEGKGPTNRGTPTFYAFHKGPKKTFGWLKISFDDGHGANYCGTWYSHLMVEESTQRAPRTLEKIKSLAKMAAVAIPLKYMVLPDHPDRNKYCVITNWWKERNSHGQYVFPTLDFSLYDLGNDT